MTDPPTAKLMARASNPTVSSRGNLLVLSRSCSLKAVSDEFAKYSAGDRQGCALRSTTCREQPPPRRAERCVSRHLSVACSTPNSSKFATLKQPVTKRRTAAGAQTAPVPAYVADATAFLERDAPTPNVPWRPFRGHRAEVAG